MGKFGNIWVPVKYKTKNAFQNTLKGVRAVIELLPRYCRGSGILGTCKHL